MKPKCRICYVIGSLQIGGAQRHLMQLMECLDDNSFEIHIAVLLQEGGLLSDLDMSKIEFINLNSRARLYSPGTLVSILKLRRFLTKHQIDIVHTYLFEATFIGIIAAFLAGVKVRLIGKRSMLFRRNRRYELLASRVINALSTGIICVSDAVRRDVAEKEKGVGGKGVTIYNGVNVDLYRDAAVSRGAAARKGNRIFTVGYVGSLKPVKDLPTLIEAMSALHRICDNFKAVLVGEGPLLEDLSGLIREKGLSDKVLLIGPSLDIPGILKDVDIGVLTSTSEGLSNTLLEFMASGIPTVATAVGGNPEVIEDGVDGVLVRARDPNAVSEKIHILMNDPGLYSTLSRNCREKVIEKFDFKNMVAAYEDYYLDKWRG